jgi:hypothetical protein
MSKSFKQFLKEWGGESDHSQQLSLNKEDQEFLDAHDDIDSGNSHSEYTLDGYTLYIEKDLGRGKEYAMYTWSISKDDQIIDSFPSLKQAYDFIKGIK